MMEAIIHAVIAFPVAKHVVIQTPVQVAMQVSIYPIINVKVVVHHVFLEWLSYMLLR